MLSDSRLTIHRLAEGGDNNAFASDVRAGLSATPKALSPKYFYDESNVRLQRVSAGRVRVKDVTVFETDTTTAKYSE